MGQPYWTRHPQSAAGFAGHARHRFVGHLGLQQHGLAVAQITFADRGQFQLAGGALEQPGVEAFFQLGDTPRQSGLGNAQQPPGRRETAGFDDFGEVVQVIEVLHVELDCPVSGTNYRICADLSIIGFIDRIVSN
ncbi:hypothetical protein D3C78_1618970 [compost metagenome]